MTATLIFIVAIMQGLLLLTAALFLLWLIFLFLPAFFSGPPFVGTKPARVETMLKLANVVQGELVMDLGCGDGRLLVAAVQTGAKVEGYEINLFLVWRARINLWRSGARGKAKIFWKNFWQADLRQADVVMIFGFSNIMSKLESKLQKELKPGARLVSYRYQLPSWQCEAELNHVYLYKKR